MKKLILISLLCTCMVQVYSQSEPGEITIEKKRIYHNGDRLKPSQLKGILGENPASTPDFEIYKTNSAISSVFLIGTGVFVCMAGVSSLKSSSDQLNDLNNGNLNTQSSYSSGLGYAIAGLACVVVAIPFSLKAKKHLYKSVSAYNTGLKNTGNNAAEINMNVGYNSIGLSLRF